MRASLILCAAKSIMPNILRYCKASNGQEQHLASSVNSVQIHSVLNPVRANPFDSSFFKWIPTNLGINYTSASSQKWEAYRWLQKGLDARRE